MLLLCAAQMTRLARCVISLRCNSLVAPGGIADKDRRKGCLTTQRLTQRRHFSGRRTNTFSAGLGERLPSSPRNSNSGGSKGHQPLPGIVPTSEREAPFLWT